MSKKLYSEESVQTIADAIRSKIGKTDKMKISEMSSECMRGIEMNNIKFEEGDD